MSESNLMRSIMLAVSNIGTRLFRFNTALSWVGRVQREPTAWKTVIQPSDIVIRNARPLHAGFDGASDLIGWSPIIISGKTYAIFTAIEVKVPGAKTDAERLKNQKNFIDQVNKSGGIGLFAESEEEALLFINSFRFNKL